MDEPQIHDWLWTAHLFSSKPGLSGSRELFNFAATIGLKNKWLQFPGTPKEHFDLFGLRTIRQARKSGAEEISPKVFAIIVSIKKAYEATRPRSDYEHVNKIKETIELLPDDLKQKIGIDYCGEITE
jgi:hypothetical protein